MNDMKDILQTMAIELTRLVGVAFAIGAIVMAFMAYHWS